jgi:hypothetical protein
MTTPALVARPEQVTADWHTEVLRFAAAIDDHSPVATVVGRPIGQQVCRVHDGERTGIGALEQLVIGPYAPAGIAATADRATSAPGPNCRAEPSTSHDRPSPATSTESAPT